MSKRWFLIWLLCGTLVSGLCSNGMAAWWGSKEIETEKIAMNFAREVERGGYKIVTAEELKGWLDQKK
ncbi:MAG: hypothetical protein AB1638_10205, partial [Nitrospirota bacterium]